MKASEITSLGWTLIQHFGPEEFLGWKDRWGDLVQPPPPASMLPFLDAGVPHALNILRERLGARLLISRAVGAIARTWSIGSQHYCGGTSGRLGRISLACDLWVPGSTLREVYEAALATPAIGAFGAYPQWNTYPGIHVDLRPRKHNGSLGLWMARYQGTGKERVQVYGALDWLTVDKMIAERDK